MSHKYKYGLTSNITNKDFRMKKKIALLALPVFLIAGCSQSPDFHCDNPIVRDKVVSMTTDRFNEIVSRPGTISYMLSATQQILAAAGVDKILEAEEDYKNISFHLKAIRTTKQDKDLGNYECKANLVSIKGAQEAEVEVSYSSERVSGGKESYIQVSGISEYDVGVLASVLIKEKELIEKTTKGELSYGTLDSSIGEFSFISNSAVGKNIFSECKVMEACEVKAMVEETKYGDIIRELIYAKKI